MPGKCGAGCAQHGADPQQWRLGRRTFLPELSPGERNRTTIPLRSVKLRIVLEPAGCAAKSSLTFFLCVETSSISAVRENASMASNPHSLEEKKAWKRDGMPGDINMAQTALTRRICSWLRLLQRPFVCVMLLFPASLRASFLLLI